MRLTEGEKNQLEKHAIEMAYYEALEGLSSAGRAEHANAITGYGQTGRDYVKKFLTEKGWASKGQAITVPDSILGQIKDDPGMQEAIDHIVQQSGEALTFNRKVIRQAFSEDSTFPDYLPTEK